MSNKYSGMTVNERLYLSGYIDEFDNAIKRKDIEKVKTILSKIEIDEPTVNSILKNYGFNT